MPWSCLPNSQGMFRVSHLLPREERAPAGTAGNFQRVCLHTCFFPPEYFSCEAESPTASPAAGTINCKMHRANSGVPGAKRTGHRGSSSSTVECNDAETGAERERVGHFGSGAGAGREQRGNVTRGPVA